MFRVNGTAWHEGVACSRFALCDAQLLALYPMTIMRQNGAHNLACNGTTEHFECSNVRNHLLQLGRQKQS